MQPKCYIAVSLLLTARLVLRNHATQNTHLPTELSQSHKISANSPIATGNVHCANSELKTILQSLCPVDMLAAGIICIKKFLILESIQISCIFFNTKQLQVFHKIREKSVPNLQYKYRGSYDSLSLFRCCLTLTWTWTWTWTWTLNHGRDQF